jgi:two-component system cell cycle sensor histidine kinase/response regulator CckA
MSEDGSTRAEQPAEARPTNSQVLSAIEKAAEGICVARISASSAPAEFIVWNRRMVEITGYTREQINRLGWQVLSGGDPALEALNLDRVVAIRRGEELTDQSMTIIRADGQRRTLAVSTSQIWERGGERDVLGFVRDATERIRAEQALRASEENYRAIFNSTGEAMVIVDTETGIVADANQAFLDLYGATAEEAVGRSAFDKDVATRTTLDIPGTMRKADQEGPQVVEYQGRSRDGRTFWVEAALRSVRIGGRRRILAVLRDISQRKRASDELRRLATAVEQAAEDIFITDPDGVIQYANPAFERTTGFSREEVIGKKPSLLKSGVHPNAFYEQLWQTIQSGRAWTGRLVNRRKDGSLVTEDATISPILDSQGATMGYVSLKRDVTHQERFEGQLRHAQKLEAVGQLAGGVAHDFNNLLQGIRGHSELALADLPTNHPSRESLAQVIKATDRAADLVRRLMLFSRREAIRPEYLDLNDIVSGLMRLVERLIGENVELRLTLGDGLWKVQGDAVQIEQILVNLCLNSRDAMPGGGLISVRTENASLDADFCAAHPWAREGDFVQIQVTDNGVGMSAAVKQHLFEPFYTTKEVGQGTGLGLATAFGIIKQHDGLISVYSEESLGTSVRIYLPAVKELPEGRAEPLESQASGAGGTILLAEDEELVRGLAVRVLTRAGYRVIPANDGEEAVRVFEEHAGEIDLALLDVLMPKLSGQAVCEALRRRRPDLPVLFTSGYTREHLLSTLGPTEATEVLLKPYQPQDLLNRIRRVLTSPRRER